MASPHEEISIGGDSADTSTINHSTNEVLVLIENPIAGNCLVGNVCQTQQINTNNVTSVCLPVKRKRGGHFDFVGRNELQSIQNPKEKLQKILHFYSCIPENHRDMSESARNFANNIIPVVSCLNKHFQGDLDAFVSKWKVIPHYSFKKVCCHGGDAHCSH